MKLTIVESGRKVVGSCLAFGALLFSAVGCQSMNESNVMRGAEPIPAFQADRVFDFTGEKSVTGIDRSDWPSTTVLVSADDGETQSTLGTWKTLNRNPVARNRGAFPTAETASDYPVRSNDIFAQYAEIIFEPIHQWVNIGLLPAFAIKSYRNGHDGIEYGPGHSYVRAVHTDESDVELFPAK